MEAQKLEGVLSEARECYQSGKTRSLSWRKSQLKALLNLLREKEEEIFRVLNEDLGKHPVESFRDEVGFLIKSVNYHLDNLNKWVAPKKIPLPLLAFPSTAEIVPEPLGLVLLLSSWNMPIGVSLEPLLGAISAGNAVVLKPSEHAPSSSAFLANTLPKYLDSKAVKVIEGGVQVGEQLLEHKWDKIFVTGSSRIGRIVMTAAAKHLTPVTLELGGKCPAIIDSISGSRDRKVTIERLVGGKFGPCCGQACIAVDYIIVEEKFAPTLIESLKETMKRFYTKPEYTSRIINKHHFQRLCDLLKGPSVESSIVHGGSMDIQNLTIEPTILLNPPLDSDIMTEEIFGPLLPIITVKKIEDSIDFIQAKPKPLVIHGFTNDEKLKRRIVEETSSGTVIFNDCLIQYVLDTAPFGGIGQSGFGRYHGKFSFDAFSHEKPVLRRSFFLELSFRNPPWTENKLQLMRHLYVYDYFGALLVLLGLKR